MKIPTFTIRPLEWKQAKSAIYKKVLYANAPPPVQDWYNIIGVDNGKWVWTCGSNYTWQNSEGYPSEVVAKEYAESHYRTRVMQCLDRVGEIDSDGGTK